MKKICGLFLVGSLVSLAGADITKDQAMKVITATDKAISTKNIAAIDGLLAKGFVYISFQEARQDRKTTIDQLRELTANSVSISSTSKFLKFGKSAQGTFAEVSSVTKIKLKPNAQGKSDTIVVSDSSRQFVVQEGGTLKVKMIRAISPQKVLMNGKPMPTTPPKK